MAITMLSGVILVNGGMARAEEESAFFAETVYLTTFNDTKINRQNDNVVEEFSSSSGDTYPGVNIRNEYIKNSFYTLNAQFQPCIITLKPSWQFRSAFLHFENVSASRVYLEDRDDRNDRAIGFSYSRIDGVSNIDYSNDYRTVTITPIKGGVVGTYSLPYGVCIDGVFRYLTANTMIRFEFIVTQEHRVSAVITGPESNAKTRRASNYSSDYSYTDDDCTQFVPHGDMIYVRFYSDTPYLEEHYLEEFTFNDDLKFELVSTVVNPSRTDYSLKESGTASGFVDVGTMFYYTQFVILFVISGITDDIFIIAVTKKFSTITSHISMDE
jgi:hypothetical protein